MKLKYTSKKNGVYKEMTWPYKCDIFKGCLTGFMHLYDLMQHYQVHILEGDITKSDYKKYKISPSKIFQINMRMVYILEKYYDGLYNPLIRMAPDIFKVYESEVKKWHENNKEEEIKNEI